jgi:uncharacterized repeat protein (TIGR03803 family)
MLSRILRQFASIAVPIFCLSFSSLCWAATENVAYSFTGGTDGSNPAAQLIFDSQGNLYGTTVTGGDFDCGTVFKLTPMNGQWQQSVLFSFDCFEQGKNPYGGVTLDTAGNLYGTTVAGGSGGFCTGDGCGVVYKLSPSGGSWTETVLYNFADAPDATNPGSAVILDGNGNIYGTTPDGGLYGQGTVFQLQQVNGHYVEQILYNFSGGDDGAVGSLGPLLMDGFGNLYGVTELGGANGAGTVYRMRQNLGNEWDFTTLYAFQGQPDAAFPYGGLIADAHGVLYGTTYFGGTSGAGAVFKLDPGPTIGTSWRETVLYSFSGGSDGGYPTTTVLFDPAGNLLGTTSAGGDPGCDCGVVFQLSSSGQSVLHTFSSAPDGAYSYYGLTPDGAGNYFGTTAAGGLHNKGAVFQVTLDENRNHRPLLR